MLAIVAAHVAAAWALLQVNAVREAVIEMAPIFVSLLAPPAPPTPAPKPLPPPELPTRKPQLRPTPAPPRPVAPPLPAPPLSVPDVAPTETAPMAVLPTSPAALPMPVAAPPATVRALALPPAPVAPAAPKPIPDAAVQYLEPPQLLYPPLSIRKRETGLVIVRAYISTTGGTPRSVDLEKSSSHARLDQAALSAVRLARFKPYAENGVPVEGWALIPIRFELEK